MAFLNPLVLFGLIAAVIPLAVHFLGRRRPRRVAFSAFFFLEEVRRQQFRRLRFRHLLLLILRTLIIVFLVLAFARPTMRAGMGLPGAEGSAAMVVLLDDGPGMGYHGTRGMHLDNVRERLLRLASIVRGNDWAVLIRTSRPDIVLPFNRETLSRIREPAEWSGDGTVALRHASRLLSGSDAASRELYIASDLSGPPWQDVGDVPMPHEVTGYLVTPPSESLVNLSVDSVSAGGELVRVGHPVRVEAAIANTGEENVRDAVVALWLNNTRVQQRTVSVQVGGRAKVSFQVVPGTAGRVSGRVQLADDPLPVDNTRWFTLDIPSRTNLLVVGPDGPSRGLFVSLFGDGSDVYTVVERTAADATRDDLQNADVTVLCETSAVDDRTRGWLAGSLRRGVGLLFLVGPESDLMVANRQVLPLITRARFLGLRSTPDPDRTADPAGLSTSGMRALAGVPRITENLADTAAFISLSRVGQAHPVTDGLLKARPASRPRIGNYARMAGGARPLMTLTNGDPLLVVDRGSAGRGAVFTAGLHPAWSDIVHRGIVVPLFHRLVNHLARPVGSGVAYVAGPGRAHSIEGAHTDLAVVSPDNIRRSVVGRQHNGSTMIEPGLLRPTGVWSVLSRGQDVDAFAVNLDPRESTLRSSGTGPISRATGIDDFRRLDGDPGAEVRDRRRGTELDIFMLIACLACIAAEMWLMRGVALESSSSLA